VSDTVYSDRFCPHAPQVRFRHVPARDVTVDELLKAGIPKLNDDIVDPLDEPWIAQQFAEKPVLLLEPVHFDERDDWRLLEERGQPLPRGNWSRGAVRSFHCSSPSIVRIDIASAAASLPTADKRPGSAVTQ